MIEYLRVPIISAAFGVCWSRLKFSSLNVLVINYVQPCNKTGKTPPELVRLRPGKP